MSHSLNYNTFARELIQNERTRKVPRLELSSDSENIETSLQLADCARTRLAVFGRKRKRSDGLSIAAFHQKRGFLN